MLKPISQLPTRYEPLVAAFGEQAKTTFLPQNDDLDVLKTLLERMRSSGQGKMMFVFADTGAGKTTFIHSLEVFVSDRVEKVVRLPPDFELQIDNVPQFLSTLPVGNGTTIVNFDQREAPSFDESEYRTLLNRLNGILRSRRDLLILWPVNDREFAERLFKLMAEIGGKSAFGTHEIYQLRGLDKQQYKLVLTKLLQLANWHLEDAAIASNEVDEIEQETNSIGGYLDGIQELIAERFDVANIGITLPQVIFILSSGEPKIKEICRNLRRADSYYIKASRLMMYTKRSNVAEWWQERAQSMTTALPYVVALFDAQLVSVSGSTVAHAIRHFGPEIFEGDVIDIQRNLGNARRVAQSSELFKFSVGQDVDHREYGLSVREETLRAYERIQAKSREQHKEINKAIVELINVAGGGLGEVSYEIPCGSKGTVTTDGQMRREERIINLEFHHKAANETTNNRVAIYILEKLKEYAINYGLTPR